MGILLNTQVSQSLSLTPQLQQAIHLLQLSSSALEDELATIAEENPLLEFEKTAERFSAPTSQKISSSYESTRGFTRNGSDDGSDQEFEKALGPVTLLTHLEEQIRHLPHSDFQKNLTFYLAGHLDERGYLRESLEDIATDLADRFTGANISLDQEVTRSLGALQSLDPPGIGARDLSDCLILQIKRKLTENTKNKNTWELAIEIAECHLENVAKRNLQPIKKACRKSEQEILHAIKLIQSLDHNPAHPFEEIDIQGIIPDVLVKNVRGKWLAEINPYSKPKLSLNNELARVFRDHCNAKSNAALNQKLLEARWLLKNIAQREVTILRVANEIVAKQKNFFSKGAVEMRPLILKEIAESLNLHESTVSRVTTQKYLSCSSGIFELKHFFSSQLLRVDGSSISSTAVQALIQDIVSNEQPDKPVSDSAIADILESRGHLIARRTVTKYRELLHIPSTSMRRHGIASYK
ncbi:RNA polymerase factor sigma-54 [Polynucleobacter sp. MWH-UH35A]|uniref:RNA polymerase factor sigma-54 n=1 Tax=Polynucleobacter sp. MWH-UH35A TaxID=1855619 RepID=UPI001BFD984A|nr:RNA polymerase factor sigma-54 [Polynucleobacter sp. MWH-UH35A]QWD59535.1 RNA polymerase factor sigma-54 [Polynucleobacter sp. MWH-UH35A]